MLSRIRDESASSIFTTTTRPWGEIQQSMVTHFVKECLEVTKLKPTTECSPGLARQDTFNIFQMAKFGRTKCQTTLMGIAGRVMGVGGNGREGRAEKKSVAVIAVVL